MLETYLPRAIQIGMTAKAFLHSTPAVIRMTFKAHDRRVRDEALAMRVQAWENGIYVLAALSSSFGKKRYPPNPAEEELNSVTAIAERTGRTEAEVSQELRLITLQVQAANSRINAK